MTIDDFYLAVVIGPMTPHEARDLVILGAIPHLPPAARAEYKALFDRLRQAIERKP